MRNEDGSYVMGTWETVCTIEEWEAVNAVFEARKTNRDVSTKYLLSGITRCGRCGHKMRGQKRNTASGHAYTCVANKPGACGKVSVVAKPVDELILELVWRDAERSAGRIATKDVEWPKQAKLNEVEEEIAFLRAQWAKKEISNSTFIFMVEELEKRKTELRHDRALFNASKKDVSSSQIDLRKQWEGLSIEQQRKAIRHTLAAVLVQPAGKGKRFDPQRIEPVFQGK
jgi:hypothetical protein